MLTQEILTEIGVRADTLERDGRDVQLVEAACYRVIERNANTQTQDWKMVGNGIGMLVPAMYTQVAPEIVEYARYVTEYRSEAVDSVRRIWERVVLATNSPDLLSRAREKIVELPAVMLSLSPTEKHRTAELLGLPEEILSNALDHTPWWKASENVEFRCWADLDHDIVAWVTRAQDLAVSIAMQNHYWHETTHHAIDYVSSMCGWPVSNFLTEGVCEFWSADSRTISTHANRSYALSPKLV